MDNHTINDMFNNMKEYELEYGDTLILSTILNDLENQDKEDQKLFLTKDKDFATPLIDQSLDSHKCKLIIGFPSGLEYFKHL